MGTVIHLHRVDAERVRAKIRSARRALETLIGTQDPDFWDRLDATTDISRALDDLMTLLEIEEEPPSGEGAA